MPGIATRAWEAGEAGDLEAMRECNAQLLVATKISRLAHGGGPNAATLSGMKSAVKMLGVIDQDTVTRPLRPLSDEEKQQIPAVLKELGLTG